MTRFGYNDFVKLLLCIVVPILLIVMLVNFIRYYKQKKNNNIIGDEKKWIYICAVVIDIILFLNISTFLEFSATLLLLAIIGILLVISIVLRVNEKENLSIRVYLIATIYLIYIIIQSRIVGVIDLYDVMSYIFELKYIILGILVVLWLIFVKSAIKYLCKNDELYRKKFYLSTTILAIYTYVIAIISNWEEKEEFLIILLAIPILFLIISDILNKVNKKGMANIIYFCTIICVFVGIIFNMYDHISNYTEITITDGLPWQVEINAFNSAYDSYEGDQKGSSLKQLISTVISSNATQDINKIISVKVGNGEATSDSTGLSTARSQLVAGKTYTVSFDYNTLGYISTINIVEKNSEEFTTNE